MTTATLTIGHEERDVLHGLMCRRLFILGMEPVELARKEGASVEEVAEGFGEDLRLMQDIGWEFEGTSSSVELTMPAESLARTLRRLRRDARRAPCEERHEREPEESEEGRWQRFRRGVKVCEELLERLDPPVEDEAPSPTIATCPATVADDGLGPYTPVTDGLIFAAVERAELHEESDEVWITVLTKHLGFEPVPDTNRLLIPRLEDLRRAGLLTSTEKRGEPFWSLTSAGREQLNRLREANEIGELPEAPQHRTWRQARVQAALRVEEFRSDLTDVVGKAYDLLYQYDPVRSKEWFAMSDRLRRSSWRFASATYCLTEWLEPEDQRPDVDENPGPSPGRRAISAWDQPATDS